MIKLSDNGKQYATNFIKQYSKEYSQITADSEKEQYIQEFLVEIEEKINEEHDRLPTELKYEEQAKISPSVVVISDGIYFTRMRSRTGKEEGTSLSVLHLEVA